MKRKNARGCSGAAISEFAPALFIFLILFLLPCCNLVFYSAAVVSVQHIVEEASRAAAIASTQTEAISNVGAKASAWVNGTGMGAFAHLTPANTNDIKDSNGKASGCSLEILVTDSKGPRDPIQVQNNVAKIPLPFDDPQDPNTNASTVQYEYQVTGTYTVTPFLNMAGIPFVGQVPAVGAPTTVTYTSKAQIENVTGLDN